jgi:hypothetical protein
MTSGINLRRFYETRPYRCTDTELSCLIEGRQAVVGDPERWFHLYFPDQPYREGLEVLVIGCSNLEAARLAAGASHTRFLAIDHDDTALDQLDRLKQHYRLGNIELMWLGADQIQVLDRQFDVIFCPEGLPPPLQPTEFLGLVRERLAVSGAMNLTVGGRHGNVGVMLFRRLLETAGLDADTLDAASVRQWIEALPAGHPFRAATAGRPDLVHDAGLLDALLTCEPAFSIAELNDLLVQCGLCFQRFLCQAHYMPECSGLASFPQAGPAIRPAAEAERHGLFALTELFRGNLRTHTLVACRDDLPPRSWAVSFAGQDWLSFIPIRNPGLEIDVGAYPGEGVARLSWAAHDDPAIALIVDEAQSRLFDAIDGARSIAQILAAVPPSVAEPEQVARSFFHTMWCRDFAWFQIPSAEAGGGPGRENPL